MELVRGVAERSGEADGAKRRDGNVSVGTGEMAVCGCVGPETVHAERLYTPLYSLYINYIQTLTGRAPT